MKHKKDDHYYKIGELAKIAGCTVAGIRYYEKLGLLDNVLRTGGGFRLYTKKTLSQLFFIKNAKSVGFNISQINKLLELEKSNLTSKSIKNEINERKQAVEKKIQSLMEIKETLSLWEKSCDEKKPVDQCPILKKMYQHTSANNQKNKEE